MAKTIDQISVFVENKAGSLVDITRILGDANIDIRAMSLADTADFGVLRMIVDRPDDAVLALRGNYCIVNVTKVMHRQRHKSHRRTHHRHTGQPLEGSDPAGRPRSVH